MKTLRAYVVKEILEGIRTYRFLIMGAIILFLAFFDPVTLKVLPLILSSQMPGADLSSLVSLSQTAAFEGFLGDLFEIGTLVVCLVLMGTVAKERETRSLVLPLTNGAGYAGILAAKVIVPSVFIGLVVFFAVPIAYFYGGILFPGERAVSSSIPSAAFHYAVYFMFLTGLVTFFSSLFKKGLPAGLCALAVAYGLPALTGLFKATRFIPMHLALGSYTVSSLRTDDFLPAILSSLGCIVLFYLGAYVALRKAEL
jgi:ABC-2 type transport system permease protein